MYISGYLRKLDTARFSSLECPACGSSVLTTGPAGFCQFCEMYAEEGMKKPNKAASKQLSLAHSSISKGDLPGAASSLEKLEESEDPVLLYGVGSIYEILSDYTYMSVNYSLHGFMYSNADKRNDEYDKNPGNSMHLLSKAKEMAFSAVYMAEKSGSKDWLYAYVKFMAEMRMRRYAQAWPALSVLENGKAPVVWYADMVYAVETKRKDAEKTLKQQLAGPEPNAYYYLARYLSSQSDLADTQKVLAKICAKVRMPMAEIMLQKAAAVDKATML